MVFEDGKQSWGKRKFEWLIKLIVSFTEEIWSCTDGISNNVSGRFHLSPFQTWDRKHQSCRLTALGFYMNSSHGFVQAHKQLSIDQNTYLTGVIGHCKHHSVDVVSLENICSLLHRQYQQGFSDFECVGCRLSCFSHTSSETSFCLLDWIKQIHTLDYCFWRTCDSMHPDMHHIERNL